MPLNPSGGGCGRDSPGCPQPGVGADLAGSGVCSSLSSCPWGAVAVLPPVPLHCSWAWGRSPPHPSCSSWCHCSRSPALLQWEQSRDTSILVCQAGNGPHCNPCNSQNLLDSHFPKPRRVSSGSGLLLCDNLSEIKVVKTKFPKQNIYFYGGGN